jgi:hypothetical protein
MNKKNYGVSPLVEKGVAFQAFMAMSARQRQRFRKWLLSPLHNTHPELTAVVDYWSLCEKKGVPAHAAAAFAAAFPEKSLDEKKMRHLLSGLMTQVKDFWAWEELQADPWQSRRYALRSMRKHNLEAAFVEARRATTEALEQQEMLDLESPLVYFHTIMEQFQWNLAQKRRQPVTFEALADHLIAYLTLQMLRLGYMYRSQQALHKETPHALDKLDALLRAFPPESQQQYPYVALFYAGFQLLSHPDEDHWLADFRDRLTCYAERLPTDEARDLLMLAINHCIRRINQGQRQYLAEVLTFYDMGLRQQWLLDERKHLTKYTYNNVLLTIIALRDWERAGVFLEAYRQQLPPADRDKVYEYNKAVLCFRKGDYEMAQTLLRTLSFSDPMYNLEARRMLLRIYYEKKEYDALESLLDNLLTWLRRHRELGYHREMYRNLALFTGKLLRLPPADKQKRQKLAAKIKDTPLVADRDWLLQNTLV